VKELSLFTFTRIHFF